MHTHTHTHTHTHSLLQFVKGAGSFASEMADAVLNSLTGGRHETFMEKYHTWEAERMGKVVVDSAKGSGKEGEVERESGEDREEEENREQGDREGERSGESEDGEEEGEGEKDEVVERMDTTQKDEEAELKVLTGEEDVGLVCEAGGQTKSESIKDEQDDREVEQILGMGEEEGGVEGGGVSRLVEEDMSWCLSELTEEKGEESGEGGEDEEDGGREIVSRSLSPSQDSSDESTSCHSSVGREGEDSSSRHSSVEREGEDSSSRHSSVEREGEDSSSSTPEDKREVRQGITTHKDMCQCE